MGPEQSMPESGPRRWAWAHRRIQRTIRVIRRHPFHTIYEAWIGFLVLGAGLLFLSVRVLHIERFWSGTTVVLIGLIGGLVGAMLNVYSFAARNDWEIKPESLRDRVKRLTSSLQYAMKALEKTSAELQKEIDQSQQLLAKLEQDAQSYEQLAQINRPGREAVAMLVRGEVKAESSRSSRQQFLLNLGFFIAGAALSVLLQ